MMPTEFEVEVVQRLARIEQSLTNHLQEHARATRSSWHIVTWCIAVAAIGVGAFVRAFWGH